MNNAKLSPGNWVILIAGGLMLIASFLDFWSFDAGGFSSSFTAWDGDLFFPVTIIPVLCGLAMAGHVAATSFANVNLPERVLGMGWNQIHLALGFQAGLMMIAFVFQNKLGYDAGIGLWLMVLCGIGLAVGAFLRQNEPASAPPLA